MKRSRPKLTRRLMARVHRQELRDPIEIISPARLDIAAKTIFARAYLENNLSGWPTEVYKEHIRSINKFYEKDPEKNTYDDFKDAFIKVINGVKNSDKWKHKKPVEMNDSFLMNGAHRVAASVVLGDRVNVTYPRDVYTANWGYGYFRSARDINWDGEKTILNEDILDAMTIEYVSLKRKNIFVAIIFPAARGHRNEAYNHLSSLGEIVNMKSFRHDEFNGNEIIKQLYCDSPSDDWNNGIDFNNTKNKSGPCFRGDEDLQVYILESNIDETTRVKEKQYLRSLWGIDKHSIHITDTIEEANRVVRMFFNKNSRNFLKIKRKQEFKSLEMYNLFNEYVKRVPKNIYNREKIAIEGSAVMDLLNIREGKDLDYISQENRITPSFENVERHGVDENIYHSKPIKEIITNPKYHFYYKGYKIVDIIEIKKYKERRYAAEGDAKDRRDVELINVFLNQNPQYGSNSIEKHPSGEPLVSIIMPVFNVEKFLARSIESVIYQTYRNIEVIIVIDGSPDNSLQIARRYADLDSRIRIINLSRNGGLFGARMAGFDIMTGAFFTTVDSDDFIDEGMIERLIIAAKESQSDIVIPDGYTCVAEGEEDYQVDVSDVYEKSSKSFLQKASEDGWGWEVWGKLYKKDIFSASQRELQRVGQRVNYGEDILFAVMFTSVADSIYRLTGEYGYRYSVNNDSIMRAMTIASVAEKLVMLNAVLGYVEEFLRATGRIDKELKSLERFRALQTNSLLKKYDKSKLVNIDHTRPGVKGSVKLLIGALKNRLNREIGRFTN